MLLSSVTEYFQTCPVGRTPSKVLNRCRICFIYMRKIAALAFAPPADVVDLFVDLKATLPQEANGVADYSEKYYIGQIQGGQRRQPLFPIVLWNVNQQVLAYQCRTNNRIKGWHRRFSSELGGHHPTVWRIIDALKSEERQSSQALERMIAGHVPPPRKRKYVEVDRRLQQIVERYDGRDGDAFLRGIAHNLCLGV